MTDGNIDKIRAYLLNLQNNICHELSTEDGNAHFKEDSWTRNEGGGGLTRVLKNGKVLEQAGVNFSEIEGTHLPQAATANRKDLQDITHFKALGVSVVIHPQNPYVPTAHANVRFFCATKENQDPIWWFGGGFDLTPYYPFEEDCIHWHQTAHDACKPFGPDIYPKFKQNADDYFYIKHRNEHRGIGGLFFDDLNEWPFEKCFEFMQSIGNHFMKAYRPILHKRKQHPYTDHERAFQLYRRGRYVEFNLVYDRGTLFGLQSQGRTESILMSLPPNVRWEYDWKPEANSPESTLYTHFLKPRDWLKKEHETA